MKKNRMTNTNCQNEYIEMQTINRGAIVLEPTEAYLQWAKELPDDDSELTLEDLRNEYTVYLIPEFDFEPKAWLKRNYEFMFEHELEGWCADDTLWPQDRSFKAFEKFFNTRFCSMVIDMGKGPIVRDDDDDE